GPVHSATMGSIPVHSNRESRRCTGFRGPARIRTLRKPRLLFAFVGRGPRVASLHARGGDGGLALGGAAPRLGGTRERGTSPAPRRDDRDAERGGTRGRLLVRDRGRRASAGLRPTGRSEQD